MADKKPPAEKKQVVRKVAPNAIADFDEQWWPITLLLLVSAGALAGYVYTSPTSDFTTTVWYRNAWYQIYFISGLAAALVFGLAFLRGSSNRRLQLGVFLSLAFHIALIYGSRQIYLTYASEGLPADVELPADEEVRVVIPDYIPEPQEDDAANELTKPVESKPTPDRQAEITPQAQEKEKIEKENVTEPERPAEPQPKPLEVARAELPTPQPKEIRPEEKLNRKTVEEQLPTEQAPQPKPERQERKQTDPTNLASAAQQALEAEAAERPAMRDPRPELRATAASPAEVNRRDIERQLAMTDVRASLDRKLTEAVPELRPAPQIEMPAAAMPQREQPRDAATVGPAVGDVRNALTTAPVASPQVSPSLTLQSGPAAATQLSRAESPQPSQFPSPNVAQNLQKRSNYGAVPNPSEVVVDAPAAQASMSPRPQDTTARSSSATTIARGDFGNFEQVSRDAVAAPSNVGIGAGQVPGGPFVGPQRMNDVGEGTSGQAAATTPYARPGRQRFSGTADLGLDQVPLAGTPGMPGANQTAGNAASGNSNDARATTVGAGAGLGERLSVLAGPSMRSAPTGGGMPGGTGTAAAVGGSGTSLIGSATGTGSAPLGASGAGVGPGSTTTGTGGAAGGGMTAGSATITRREFGETAGSSAGNLGGEGRRGRMKAEGPRDRHGNLLGSEHDLIVDGQMIGEKIVIIEFFRDEEIATSPLTDALATKGYVVERLTAALPPIDDFARRLDGAKQLWLISSEVNRLPAAYLRELVERWRTGRLALCLMADNAPFTAEANAVLSVVAPGTTIAGDYLGEQQLQAGENGRPGFDGDLALFHNVETLFEGTTISHITGRYLTPVCYASNGLPLIGIYQQQGSSRLLVHCGFTSIYERFWDDAGVSRFAVNVAGWLSEADKKPAAVRVVPTPPSNNGATPIRIVPTPGR